MAMTINRDQAIDLTVLFSLNIAIVLASEFVGEGHFFLESGFIHLFGIGFVILAITRVLTNYRVYDPTLKRVLDGCLLALIILSESQVVAYMSDGMIRITHEAELVSLLNFFLAGILLIIIGVEFALKSYSKRPAFLLWLPVMGMLALMVATVAFMMRNSLVSLEPSSMMPYVYALVIVIVHALAVNELLEVGKRISVLSAFSRFVLAGSVFLGLAGLIYVSSVAIERAVGLPDYRVESLATYSFYFGVSFIFLALGRAKFLGGIYADLQAESDEAK